MLLCTGAQAQPFSLICMPDPQYYTNNTSYDLYRRQAQWIINNKDSLNIQHVIWLGDLTNNNTTSQWNVANAAYALLDNAAIPYAVVPGNHDYRTNASNSWVGANLRNLTLYNSRVGPQRFAGRSWYGGNMGNTTDHNENNYTFFSSNGINFLVIGLEYAPRKEVITWANDLISQYPNHRVILFTHAYMTTNGAYTGNSASGSGTAASATGTVGASGSELFDELVSRHNNIFMIACGHVTESVYNTKVGENGNTVYEMLVDYQSESPLNNGTDLGNGWLRILRFIPQNNQVVGSTISVASGDTNIFTNGIPQFYETVYSSSPVAADHQFTLNYDMTSPMPPYSYLNGSTSFHAMSVGSNLNSDQQDPDIAAASNGDWASVWEDDSNSDGVYQVMVRGFDPDGNERFPKAQVNVAATPSAQNPAMAMMSDGRFVVVWQSGTTAIKMRTYNADGTPNGTSDTTIITATSPGSVRDPDVGIADNGNIVVTWTDDRDGDGADDIAARGMYFNYAPGFAVKTVNTTTSGNQQKPAVAMRTNGDYVIVWDDDSAGNWDVKMRGFAANESQLFAQQNANATTVGEQSGPAVAVDQFGRFVVAYADDNDMNGAFQLFARGFNANGTQLFAERTVNVNSAGNQLHPALAMDDKGKWYCAWEDSSTGSGYQIFSNAYDLISGARDNASDQRANPSTSVSNKFGSEVRKAPTICAHRSGRYVVGWADDMDGNGNFQALTKGVGNTATSLVVKSTGGTVSRSPEEPFYTPDTQVKLTATPAPGRTFVRWTGDVPNGSVTTNPFIIVTNTDKNITAEYTGTSDVADWQLYK